MSKKSTNVTDDKDYSQQESLRTYKCNRHTSSCSEGEAFGPKGDCQLCKLKNSAKARMCKTESSLLHETESPGSMLDEDVFEAKDSYLQNLNVLRKKLDMLEVTDTASTESEKSLSKESFPYIVPKKQESILEECIDLPQKSTTKMSRKTLSTKKHSLLTYFKKSTNRNLQKMHSPVMSSYQSSHLTKTELGNEMQSCSWSTDEQKYETKTLYVKHDFNNKLDSSVGDTDATKCYVPPEKKLCIRETTPHISTEPIKRSDSFFGSHKPQDIQQQDVFVLDRCQELGDHVYAFDKRLSTTTSQDSNEYTNIKMDSNFTETSRTDNFNCIESIADSLSSSDNYSLPISTRSNRKSVSEPSFRLNLPSSIYEDTSDSAIPTVKTTVITERSDTHIKKNKSDNMELEVIKSEISTTTKKVASEESDIYLSTRIMQTSDFSLEQTTSGTSTNGTVENTQRTCIDKHSTDSFPNIEEIFSNTNEITVEENELRKLKNDLYLTSNICMPLKPKPPNIDFPVMTKVTQLTGDLELSTNSSQAGVDDEDSDPEAVAADLLNNLRIADPSGEINDYKEVASKLLTVAADQNKNKAHRMASGTSSGSTGASETIKLKSSDDILQCRRKQSTEMSFYHIPSLPSSVNSLESSPDSKTDVKSANDRNRTVGCFCFDMFFPNR